METEHFKGMFINNLFFVNNRGNLPVTNLKNKNEFISYQYFKMKGFHCLRNVLKYEDYMGKMDLMDIYFSIPSNHLFTKYS